MRIRLGRCFAGAASLVAILIGSAPAAEAGTIIDLVSAGCSGTVCSGLDYGTGTLDLTSVGGTFQYKTVNGATGLGVSGQTGGEIDVNESIAGTFSTPILLEAFRVLFIYNGPEFNDPNEKASVSINNGALSGMLTVNGENTAVWSVPGAIVTNCGATTVDGTGCFVIQNPFGSTAVSNIAFTALSVPSTSNNSDYSLSQLDVTTVPEPATLCLLGLGAAAIVRRRRAGR